MSRRPATCFLFLAFASAIVAQLKPVTSANPRWSEKAAQHGEFEISGTLVDSVTGQPINHARVAIAPVAQRDAFTTMVTGEDGQFKFGNITPGKYTLTAQARGHITESFNQHDGYSSSVVVGPELNSTGLLFQLPPEGSISGTITDEAGEPVRDAQVALYSTGISGGMDRTVLRGYARTDDQGFYRFGHLRKGKYLIGVSARPWYADHARVPPPPVITRTANGGTIGAVPGMSFGSVGSVPPTAGDRPPEQQQSPLDVAYPITFYPGVTEAESAGLITLAAGDKATANVSLQPVPALHIRIADSPQGGYVTLQKPVLDGQPMQVLSETRGMNGAIELVGVPPGHYSISTVRDFNPGQRRAGSPDALSGDIDLVENGSVERHQGMQSASLTATVTAEGTGSLEGALILTLKRGYGQVLEQNFFGSGDIEFSHGLSAGMYEVSLRGTKSLYIKSMSATGARVSGRTLEVRGGSPVKLRVVVGEGEAELQGTALRNDKPFAGAMIVLVPADPAHNLVLFRRDQSDSDGTFSLRDVVPGKYTLLALENGWDKEWTNPDVLKPYLPQGESVLVQPNGKYNVKARVQ